MIVYQNTSGSFFRVICNVEFEIMSVNSVALNSINLPISWVNLLLIYDFVTSCMDHLENIGSMIYADLPYANVFL